MQPGTYRAKATQWDLGNAKTGTAEVAIVFELTHPDMAGESITWHGYFTEGTYARTIESLRHCGWKGDDLTALDGLDANEVEIVIKEETYQGKSFPKVQWVNRAGGSLALAKPMSPTDRKAFAASMRAKIRALDAAAGRKPATAADWVKPKTTREAANAAGAARAREEATRKAGVAASEEEAARANADEPADDEADPFAGAEGDDIPF